MNEFSQTYCEACKNAPWTIIEDSDCALSPYHLCAACHKRLVSLSLRPREWYNLAVIHGWGMYYLHDNFYDDEGTAHQPKALFSISERDYAPQLQEVTDNTYCLIEYCTTKWALNNTVIKELLKHDKEKLLVICQQKYESSKSWQIKDILIEIAGSVIEKVAASWLKSLWKKEETHYIALSQASIKSLPLEEAFQLITTYLETVSPKELPGRAWSCLHLCRSLIVLDWIEPRIKEYRDDWARLTAVSSPTWAFMHKWITTGRPLSLVAIEAISACIPRAGNPYLASLNPKLREAPTYNIVEKILLEYEKIDNVPRVNKAISYIRAHADKIFTETNIAQ
jgi:hypothetical protein